MLCIHDQTARTVMSRPPPSPTSCGRIRAFRASVLASASYLKTSYFALQMTLDTLGIVIYRQVVSGMMLERRGGKGRGVKMSGQNSKTLQTDSASPGNSTPRKYVILMDTIALVSALPE